jgi:glycosyltransferase involved in cell wall biosynthesis
MPSAQFGEKYFPQYYKWLMKLLYKYADYIIAQTPDMKIEIEKYYSSPKNQIIVTINPIDIALINEQISDAINPYDDNYINIIVSGRISEEKGQVFVLKSFVNVVKQNPNFKLHLLGNISNQSYYQKVKNIILNNNIENNVEFISFKINPFPYYKFADLLVLPSKWEGLPNVVLEALYLQTPVVVTDCIPFFNELLSIGENGFIVKYGDESDLADKILKYNQLDVHLGLLNLPDYDEIFWKMLNE